jgi:hypothetical protein
MTDSTDALDAGTVDVPWALLVPEEIQRLLIARGPGLPV